MMIEVKDVTRKATSKGDLMLSVVDNKGDKYSVFDGKVIQELESLIEAGKGIDAQIQMKGNYRNIVGVKEGNSLNSNGITSFPSETPATPIPTIQSIKENNLMSHSPKDASIVAQCLTKVKYANADPTGVSNDEANKAIFETYKWFLGELSQ